jgi:hypothetical protein
VTVPLRLPSQPGVPAVGNPQRCVFLRCSGEYHTAIAPLQYPERRWERCTSPVVRTLARQAPLCGGGRWAGVPFLSSSVHPPARGWRWGKVWKVREDWRGYDGCWADVWEYGFEGAPVRNAAPALGVGARAVCGA